MKSIFVCVASFLLLFGAMSCGDLDSFVDANAPALPRLPADSCGDWLTDVDFMMEMRWSGNGEEIYYATYNSINACRLADKATRTVVGSLTSPHLVSVSADGQKLYYTAMTGYSYENGFYVVSTASGTPALLCTNAYDVFVSGDSRIAAYSLSNNIYILDLTTRATRLLRTGGVLSLSDDGAYAVIHDTPPPYYGEVCYLVSTSRNSAISLPFNSWYVRKYRWVGSEVFAYVIQWGVSGNELVIWRSSTGTSSSPISFNQDDLWGNQVDFSNDGSLMVWWGQKCHGFSSNGACDYYELRLHGLRLSSRSDTTLALAYTRSYVYGNTALFSPDGKKLALAVKGGIYVKEM